MLLEGSQSALQSFSKFFYNIIIHLAFICVLVANSFSHESRLRRTSALIKDFASRLGRMIPIEKTSGCRKKRSKFCALFLYRLLISTTDFCFYLIIPAATVLFVASSIKIKLPVSLFFLYGSKNNGLVVLSFIRAISFILISLSLSSLWSSLISIL